jgi:hypothetical protein
MPFELLHGSEVLLARRTTGLYDLVFRAHESRRVVLEILPSREFMGA